MRPNHATPITLTRMARVARIAAPTSIAERATAGVVVVASAAGVVAAGPDPAAVSGAVGDATGAITAPSGRPEGDAEAAGATTAGGGVDSGRIDVAPGATTRTVPTMSGCTAHRYEKVPAVGKRSREEAPGWRMPVSNEAERPVAVWTSIVGVAPGHAAARGDGHRSGPEGTVRDGNGRGGRWRGRRAARLTGGDAPRGAACRDNDRPVVGRVVSIAVIEIGVGARSGQRHGP